MEAAHHNPNRIANRFARFALTIIAGLAIGLVTLFVVKERDRQKAAAAAAETAAAAAAAAPPPGETLVGAGEEEEVAFADLTLAAEEFLRAPDTETLKRLVRDPDRVGPLIDRSYQDHAYRPPGFRRAKPPTSVSIDEAIIRVSAETGDFEWVELVVERAPGGGGKLLIDWESFVGYSEIPWTEMLIEKPRQPVLLRTTVAADSYYNFGFDSEDRFLCVRLSDPNQQVQVYGYAERGSEAASQLQALLETGDGARAVLRVRYPETAPATNQVVVDEVVCPGWILGL
jgi:hypothetical protein